MPDNNLNICYVAPDIPVPHTGTFVGGSTHVLKIAEGLAKRGNNVYILSRRVNKGQKRFEKLGENLFTHRVYRGIICPIERTASRKLNAPKERKGISSILESIYFLTVYRLALMIIVARIIRKHNIHIVLERNSSKGAGVLTGAIFGIPSVVEVIDPDYSNLALKLAKRVFVYTSKILDPSFPKDKVVLTSAGVDTEIFNPDADGDSIRDAYELHDKDVVVYVGEMSAWHGAENLVHVASKLDQNIGSKHQILMVGKNVESLKEVAEKNGVLDKFVFAGFVKHEDVPKYITAADVAVAPYNPKGFKYMEKYGFYFSPIKIFEYMACAKPIVTTNIEIVKDIIEKNQCGILVEPGNIDEIAHAIDYLFKNKKKAREMGRNGRSAVLKSYSWDKVSGQIYESMMEILEGGNE
ncbi:MAG: glycosyltransferase family 4 protein [Methanosarcinales archaeon]|nr:MAG: glycosyltransferase family 4 protein [Methanosarcinales archaeon]